MNDIKTSRTRDLVFRLNYINNELKDLTVEYNEIIKELWERFPNIKDDVDLQPKVMRRKYGKSKNNTL